MPAKLGVIVYTLENCGQCMNFKSLNIHQHIEDACKRRGYKFEHRHIRDWKEFDPDIVKALRRHNIPVAAPFVCMVDANYYDKDTSKEFSMKPLDALNIMRMSRERIYHFISICGAEITESYSSVSHKHATHNPASVSHNPASVSQRSKSYKPIINNTSSKKTFKPL
jgi:hypothetical protein